MPAQRLLVALLVTVAATCVFAQAPQDSPNNNPAGREYAKSINTNFDSTESTFFFGDNSTFMGTLLNYCEIWIIKSFKIFVIKFLRSYYLNCNFNEKILSVARKFAEK